MTSIEKDDSQDLTDFKQPPKKKTRFKHPLKEEEILALSKGFVPANTWKNTTWAYKVFSNWLAERNNNAEEQCPQDLLDNPDVSKLNYWLTRFVAEVRRQDGKPYPPNQLLVALQQKMLDAPKFFDRRECGFVT